MNCTEFVARFSDFEDGTVSSADLAVMEEHLSDCVSCRRYRAVVERGAALLRALPVPELQEDFVPRLQHRLYRAQETVVAEPTASRTPAVAVFGVAVLLTVMAWSPLLLGTPPVIELAPIVVDRAPASPSPARAASARDRPLELWREPGLDVGLWEDTRLYEYSALSRRYERSLATRQVGLVDNP
jgi:predicted anti-sigma-YlaC factor YlaD